MHGFISYAHDDYKMFNEFRPHLRAIERGFDVQFWSDHRINGGYHWNNAIRLEIERADLYRLPVIPRYGRVIRQGHHVWGIGNASILFSQ
jgi:hypothetical protein